LTNGANNNVIVNNTVGLDASGTVALGNSGNDILIRDAPGNRIGGSEAAAGNVIGGGLTADYPSIAIGGPDAIGNLVQGNHIGTDAGGTLDLGSASSGMLVLGAPDTIIGGAVISAGNIISGHTGHGVIAAGNGTTIVGNLIGVQGDTKKPLPNLGHGVLVAGGASDVTVGGRSLGEGNVIAFNGDAGVLIRSDAASGNTVAGNIMLGNGGLGVDLCAAYDPQTGACTDVAAVTANDAGDADTGPNGLQNFPILGAGVEGAATTTLDGGLDSLASATYTIDVYANADCDASGHGEALVYLGSDSFTTDGTGAGEFAVSFPFELAGMTLAATVTDAAGSTSELSSCLTASTGLWVDFGFTGTGIGTDDHPFATLTEAAAIAEVGATITIGNHQETGTTTSIEGPLTLSGVTLVAVDHAATIR
jgi:hypothetical protein